MAFQCVRNYNCLLPYAMNVKMILNMDIETLFRDSLNLILPLFIQI